QLSVRRIQPGQTLDIPPAPLSVSADVPRTPEAQGFNPAFATPGGASAGARVQLGAQTYGLEWTPATGSLRSSVEVAAPLPALSAQVPRGDGVVGRSGESGVARGEDGRYTVKMAAQVEAGVQASAERG